MNSIILFRGRILVKLRWYHYQLRKLFSKKKNPPLSPFRKGCYNPPVSPFNKGGIKGDSEVAADSSKCGSRICKRIWIPVFARMALRVRLRGIVPCKNTAKKSINAFNFTKTVAIITAACFAFTSVFSQGVYAIINTKREAQKISKTLEEFVIPYTAGRITDARFYSSPKVVINIQDLHCHGEVQRNISRILQALDEKYRLQKVYVEGGIGKIDTSWVNLIEDKNVRQKIVDTFVDCGKLTGAEYYSIISRRPDLLCGIEEKSLYFDNLSRLDKIMEKQKEIESFLPEIKENLEALKQRYYSKKNERLETLIKKHKDNSLQSEKFYKLLIKYATNTNLDLYDYRTLVQFLTIVDQQKKLNYKKISRELSGFISMLKQKLPYNAYTMLMERANDTSKLDELYIYLSKVATDYNFNLRIEFSALNEFFNFVEENQKINPLKLVNEERKLLRELYEAFSQSGGEREVVFIVDFFNYLEQYLDNKISAEDYQYFARNLEEFKLLWAKYINTDRIPALEPYYELFEKFYKVNIERNNYFIKNILGTSSKAVVADSSAVLHNNATNNMPINGQLQSALKDAQEIVVVVTGGFHTTGLTDLLKDKNVSYLVITPNVTQDTKFSEVVYNELAKEQAKAISSQTLALQLFSQFQEHKNPELLDENVLKQLAELENEDIETIRQKITINNEYLKSKLELAFGEIKDEKSIKNIVREINEICEKTDGKFTYEGEDTNNYYLKNVYKQININVVLDKKEGTVKINPSEPEIVEDLKLPDDTSALNKLLEAIKDKLKAKSTGSIEKIYDQSLEAFNNEMKSNTPSADVILISAGNQEMADLYNEHFKKFKGAIYRDDVPVLFVPDPESYRLGNGGAIGNTLLHLKKELPDLQKKYSNLNGKSIHELRVVLIQAGGFGTRYTVGSSLGSKTLMLLPVQLPNGEQGTLMDFVLMHSYKFTQKLRDMKRQGGLAILNGDGLLITKATIFDGITLITNPELIESTGKYGVVGFDNETKKIKVFLEKPGPEGIKSAVEKGELQGIKTEEHLLRQVQTNTASIVITDEESKYKEFLESFIEISEKMAKERIEKRIKVFEIDTSNDFFVPKTVDVTEYLIIKKLLPSNIKDKLTEDQVIALKQGRDIRIEIQEPDEETTHLQQVGGEKSDEIAFFLEIYDIVNKKFPDLYATALPETESFYIDYGDMGEWFRGIINPVPEETIVGFVKRVRAKISKESKVDESAGIFRSIVKDSAEVGKNVVVVNSVVESGSVIPEGCILHNVKGVIKHPAENSLINVSPITDMDKQLKWAVLYTGRNDKLKGTVGDMKKSKFLSDLIRKLVEYKVIGQVTAQADFMKLEIWPLQDDEEMDFELVSWMFVKDTVPPANYLTAQKVSFEYITKNINYEGIRKSNDDLEKQLPPAAKSSVQIGDKGKQEGIGRRKFTQLLGTVLAATFLGDVGKFVRVAEALPQDTGEERPKGVYDSQGKKIADYLYDENGRLNKMFLDLSERKYATGPKGATITLPVGQVNITQFKYLEIKMKSKAESGLYVPGATLDNRIFMIIKFQDSNGQEAEIKNYLLLSDWNTYVISISEIKGIDLSKISQISIYSDVPNNELELESVSAVTKPTPQIPGFNIFENIITIILALIYLGKKGTSAKAEEKRLNEWFDKAVKEGRESEAHKHLKDRAISDPKSLIDYFEAKVDKAAEVFPEDMFGKGFGYDIRGNAWEIKGGVLDLSPINCYLIGKALASEYTKLGENILITGDQRIHTPVLRLAMALGAASTGAKVDFSDEIFGTGEHGLLSGENPKGYKIMIQVSGSHGVQGKNGLKIKIDKEGSLEPFYAQPLAGIHKVITGKSFRTKIDNIQIREAENLMEQLVDYYDKTLPKFDVNQPIVFDCRNSALIPVLKKLVERRGLKKVYWQNDTPDGNMPGGIWDPSKPEALVNCQKKVKELNAQLEKENSNYRAVGFVFDGDGDRCSAILENGEAVPSFEMMLPFYQRFWSDPQNRRVIKRLVDEEHAEKIWQIADVRANSRLFSVFNRYSEYLENWYISTGYPPQRDVVKYRNKHLIDFVSARSHLTGDKSFMEEFNHLLNTYFTAEASGHQFFHICPTYPDKVIDSGIAVAFNLVHIKETIPEVEAKDEKFTGLAKKEKYLLTDLFDAFPSVISTDEVRIAAPNSVKFDLEKKMINKIKEKYNGRVLSPPDAKGVIQIGDFRIQSTKEGLIEVEGIKAQLETGGSLLFRKSNTDEKATLMFEASTLEKLVELMNEMEKLVKETREELIREGKKDAEKIDVNDIIAKREDAIKKYSQKDKSPAPTEKVEKPSDLESQIKQAAGVLKIDEKEIRRALIKHIDKKELLANFAETVGIKNEPTLENMEKAGLIKIIDKKAENYEILDDLFDVDKLNKFIDLQILSYDDPEVRRLIDLPYERIERIVTDSVNAENFVHELAKGDKSKEKEIINLLYKNNLLLTIISFYKVEKSRKSAKTDTGKKVKVKVEVQDIVDKESFEFYKKNGVDIKFSLPKNNMTNEELFESLKKHWEAMVDDLQRYPGNYRGVGTRQTVEEFYRDEFARVWREKIIEYVKKEFGPDGKNLKYIITNGIGANDQFMWELVAMYNKNRKEDDPQWIHVITVREFVKFVKYGLQHLFRSGKFNPENTLFIDISRSGTTWEGLEIAIRMLSKGFKKRITLANGGPLAEIGKLSNALQIKMSPDIGGRNMHRKTSIYYTVQTVAGMFVKEMDSENFAKLNHKYDVANAFTNREKSLPVNCGKFLHLAIKSGVEHIAMITNTHSLYQSGTIWDQYIMEGANKKDIISMGAHRIDEEPDYVLENLADSPAGKFTIGIVQLDKASPDYSEHKERINRLAEKMPLMIFTINTKKGHFARADGKAWEGPSPNQQAAFDILWTDFVTVLTRFLGVDSNANPNVKKVRELTKNYIERWKETAKRYLRDGLGTKKTNLLISMGHPGKADEEAIGTEEKQQALDTIDDAKNFGKKLAKELSGKGLLEGRNRLNIFTSGENYVGLARKLRQETYKTDLLKRFGWITETGIYPGRAHKGHEATLAYSSDPKRPMLANKTINIFCNARNLGKDEPFYKEKFHTEMKDYININGADINQTNDSMTMPNIERGAQVSPTILFEFEEITPEISEKIEAFYWAFVEQITTELIFDDVVEKYKNLKPDEELKLNASERETVIKKLSDVTDTETFMKIRRIVHRVRSAEKEKLINEAQKLDATDALAQALKDINVFVLSGNALIFRSGALNQFVENHEPGINIVGIKSLKGSKEMGALDFVEQNTHYNNAFLPYQVKGMKLSDSKVKLDNLQVDGLFIPGDKNIDRQDIIIPYFDGSISTEQAFDALAAVGIPVDAVAEYGPGREEGGKFQINRLRPIIKRKIPVVAASPVNTDGLKQMLKEEGFSEKDLKEGLYTANRGEIDENTKIVDTLTCTSNAIITVIWAIYKSRLGVKSGSGTTVHSATDSNPFFSEVSGRARDILDILRGISIFGNIQPASTGADKNLFKMVKELKGKFKIQAVRTGTMAGSYFTLTINLKEPAKDLDEIKSILRDFAFNKSDGMMKFYEGEPGKSRTALETNRIVGWPSVSIVDGFLLELVDNNKTLIINGFYDNQSAAPGQMITRWAPWVVSARRKASIVQARTAKNAKGDDQVDETKSVGGFKHALKAAITPLMFTGAFAALAKLASAQEMEATARQWTGTEIAVFFLIVGSPVIVTYAAIKYIIDRKIKEVEKGEIIFKREKPLVQSESGNLLKIIAYKSGIPAGIIMIDFNKKEKMGVILDVYVPKWEREAGVGTKLVEAAFNEFFNKGMKRISSTAISSDRYKGFWETVVGKENIITVEDTEDGGTMNVLDINVEKFRQERAKLNIGVIGGTKSDVNVDKLQKPIIRKQVIEGEDVVSWYRALFRMEGMLLSMVKQEQKEWSKWKLEFQYTFGVKIFKDNSGFPDDEIIDIEKALETIQYCQFVPQRQIMDRSDSSLLRKADSVGGLIGKLYDSSDEATRKLVKEGIVGKEENGYLVFYDGKDDLLYFKDGSEARIEILMRREVETNRYKWPTPFISTNKAVITILKDNPFIGDYANKDNIYIIESFSQNEKVIWHAVEEQHYLIYLSHLPFKYKINAHTYLRGCGKDVRNVVREAISKGQLREDFTAEEVIDYLKNNLSPERINNDEFELIRYNDRKYKYNMGEKILENCGEDIRNTVVKALNEEKLGERFTAEEVIIYLKKSLPKNRINEDEFKIIERNSRSTKGMELLYGEQDREPPYGFGVEENEKFSQEIREAMNIASDVPVFSDYKGGYDIIRISKDGKYIFTAEGNLVKIWDLTTGKLISSIEQSLDFRGLKSFDMISPDKKYIFTVQKFTVKITDIKTGQLISTIDQPVDFSKLRNKESFDRSKKSREEKFDLENFRKYLDIVLGKTWSMAGAKAMFMGKIPVEALDLLIKTMYPGFSDMPIKKISPALASKNYFVSTKNFSDTALEYAETLSDLGMNSYYITQMPAGEKKGKLKTPRMLVDGKLVNVYAQKIKVRQDRSVWVLYYESQEGDGLDDKKKAKISLEVAKWLKEYVPKRKDSDIKKADKFNVDIFETDNRHTVRSGVALSKTVLLLDTALETGSLERESADIDIEQARDRFDIALKNEDAPAKLNMIDESYKKKSVPGYMQGEPVFAIPFDREMFPENKDRFWEFLQKRIYGEEEKGLTKPDTIIINSLSKKLEGNELDKFSSFILNAHNSKIRAMTNYYSKKLDKADMDNIAARIRLGSDGIILDLRGCEIDGDGLKNWIVELRTSLNRINPDATIGLIKDTAKDSSFDIPKEIYEGMNIKKIGVYSLDKGKPAINNVSWWQLEASERTIIKMSVNRGVFTQKLDKFFEDIKGAVIFSIDSGILFAGEKLFNENPDRDESFAMYCKAKLDDILKEFSEDPAYNYNKGRLAALNFADKIPGIEDQRQILELLAENRKPGEWKAEDENVIRILIAKISITEKDKDIDYLAGYLYGTMLRTADKKFIDEDRPFIDPKDTDKFTRAVVKAQLILGSEGYGLSYGNLDGLLKALGSYAEAAKLNKPDAYDKETRQLLEQAGKIRAHLTKNNGRIEDVYNHMIEIKNSLGVIMNRTESPGSAPLVISELLYILAYADRNEKGLIKQLRDKALEALPAATEAMLGAA